MVLHSQWIDHFVGAFDPVDVVRGGVEEYRIEIRHLRHTTRVETQRTCNRTALISVLYLLTLGVHARGLQYLVYVCVRHHESCHYVQLSVQLKVPTASAQAGKHFNYGVFSKKCFVQKLWHHLHTWQCQTLSWRPISTEAPTVA